MSYRNINLQPLKNSESSGAYISYRKSSDKSQYFCRWWEWKDIKTQSGIELIGIVLFIPGHYPIMIASNVEAKYFFLDTTKSTSTYVSLFGSKYKSDVDYRTDYDGKGNTEILMSEIEELADTEDPEVQKETAVGYATSYSQSYYEKGEWYIPAYGELLVIFNNKEEIDKCRIEIGLMPFSKRFLLSSSICRPIAAFPSTLNIDTGILGGSYNSSFQYKFNILPVARVKYILP